MKSWFKAGLAAVALLAAFAVSAQPSRPYRIKPPFPSIDLPESSRGERAIQHLGGRLPEVAAWYGKAPEEFAAILRRDRTAIIDRKGRMLYQEEIDPPTGVTPTLTSSGALASLDQTFRLHSRPGSKRTIYLNFVGATLTSTVWNSSQPTITALPFDLDGVPYSFSSAELERIQYIWQRVAEDYAPFDVDVTTEPPSADRLTRSGSGDDVYGTTVLITQRTFYSCSCGGVAYLGAFDDTTDYYKPALVFYNALGGGNEKYVAEAISHEAGHNMGLHHMGTSTAGYYQGANGWAPIMGVGYYQPVVQWSRGEYADANNKEDAYTVMAGNGLAARTDDHGSTPSSATRMTGSTAGGVTTVYGSGVITGSSDVDVLSFDAGAGTVTLQATPAARSPNLDVGLELRDGAGALLASAAPTDAMAATVTASVPGGTYYVSVRGTGRGDWSTGYGTYGSVGEFAVVGTVPAAASQPPVAALSATPTTGTVPLLVSFSAGGSTDQDGSIASIEWNFGDGSALVYGATAAHTYIVPGSYMATVKVTDNTGLTSTRTVAINATSTVTPVSTTSMSVASITVTLATNKGGQTAATATVSIRDANGNPVAGANVTGNWSGAVSGSGSGTTSNAGVASISSSRTKAKGTFTFTVTGVTLAGYTYVPGSNTESSDSATR